MKQICMQACRLVAGMVLLSLAQASLAAGGNSTGTVSEILVTLSPPSGDAFVFIAGTHSAKPSCSTQTDGSWSVSLGSPGGVAMYGLVSMAKAQGKTLTVQGSGACTAWPDRETPSYILITN